MQYYATRSIDHGLLRVTVPLMKTDTRITGLLISLIYCNKDIMHCTCCIKNRI